MGADCEVDVEVTPTRDLIRNSHLRKRASGSVRAAGIRATSPCNGLLTLSSACKSSKKHSRVLGAMSIVCARTTLSAHASASAIGSSSDRSIAGGESR